MAELFFTLDKINEVCLKARVRLALMGIEIIEDVNYTATSVLKNDLVRFFNILKAVEGRKDYDWEEDDFQALVYILYYELRLSTISITTNPIFVEVGGVIIPPITFLISFLNLTDTPDSYVGQEGKIITVKQDGTGLEFRDALPDDLAGRGLIYDIDGKLTLDLESKILVTPTIAPTWTLYKNDGVTPYVPSSSNGKNITVDKGVQANLQATYSYPTPSSEQALPTTKGGSMGSLPLPAPNTPSQPYDSLGIIANASYNITFSKPKSGLIVVGGQVEFAEGSDTTQDSISISFLYKLYYGTTVKSGSILDSDILGLTSEFRTNRLKSFTNFGGGGTRILIGVPHSFGTASFKVNGLANTAFTMVRSNSDFVNAADFTDKIDVYLSDNIYNSPLDSFEII